MELNFKHFVHDDCSFFPCHDLRDWASCLFCWCPLYHRSDCGGDFVTTAGVKDCSGCHIPHENGGYDYVTQKVGCRNHQLQSAGRSY